MVPSFQLVYRKRLTPLAHREEFRLHCPRQEAAGGEGLRGVLAESELVEVRGTRPSPRRWRPVRSFWWQPGSEDKDA